MSELTYCEPTVFQRACWAIERMPSRVRAWAIRKLIRAVVRLTKDSGYIEHAKRELAPSLTANEEGPDRWMADDLIELLAVLAAQGHSGSSVGYCLNAFKALARFEPLGPLQGTPDEWIDHGNGVFQNARCGRVFKQPGRFNGQAYDIEGRVFREPSGACFLNGNSHVPVTFPYTPTTEYVDVPPSV